MKSSDPETMRSACPEVAAWYLHGQATDGHPGVIMTGSVEAGGVKGKGSSTAVLLKSNVCQH